MQSKIIKDPTTRDSKKFGSLGLLFFFFQSQKKNCKIVVEGRVDKMEE